MNFFGMKHTILTIAAVFLSLGAASAQSQQPAKPLTVEERAAAEANRLEELLKLDPAQVFYVDSTLQHDLAALEAEIKDLQKAKVESPDLYVAVSDKWAERIDRSYERFFRPDQWARYLKSGAARAQKARDKRKTKLAGK